jgi:hypothetical protein
VLAWRGRAGQAAASESGTIVKMARQDLLSTIEAFRLAQAFDLRMESSVEHPRRRILRRDLIVLAALVIASILTEQDATLRT